MTASEQLQQNTKPWLNQRRIRSHAIVLAFCLWGVCAVDYATPGIFDRAGNIKFQDFIQIPISTRLLAQGRASDLYNDQVLANAIRQIAGNTRVRLQYFQAPQVALPFVAFSRLSFLTQAAIWVTLSLLIYFQCVYQLWKTCSALNAYPGLVALCAIAYPPLFHFFVRGQLSVLILLCFTCAYLAFRQRHDWLAGIALGCLVFKPQFLLAIPLVLLVARAWKTFAGIVISAAAQLALSWLVFGRTVMRTYILLLLQNASQPELSLSPDQMHSLRSFWVLLIPSASAVWVLYVLSSVAAIVLASAVWKSSSPLALRFSALTLAAVLVNPHLFVYDLLALVPVFILAADWFLSRDPQPSSSLFPVLLYLAFVLPLFGPISRWTHIQLSVIVFVALLWILYRDRIRGSAQFATQG